MAIMLQCPVCGLYVPDLEVHRTNDIFPCAGKWVNDKDLGENYD